MPVGEPHDAVGPRDAGEPRSALGPRDTVGVLGIGRMGAPIARRLVDAGYDVGVFDTSPVTVHGARTATDARALAASVDVLVTVLPGAPELHAALSGPTGALAAMRAGTCWLDLTSCDPTTASMLADAASAASVASVGAPMGGSPDDASAGTLTFFVGGAAADIERTRPILAVLGDPGGIRMLGDDIAAGYTAKLLANTLWFGQAIAVTEVLLLGQALGIEPRRLADALRTSAGGSVFLDRHVERLLDGDYLETFGIDRVVEELAAVVGLADRAGTPADLTRLVTDLHIDALAEFGAVDGELLAAKLLERRAGRTLRSESSAPGSGVGPA